MENTVSWYAERTQYLSQFMLPERFERLKAVLEQRTKYITICSENTFHPHNASALIRNCEAFGLQEIHAVETLCRFRPSKHVVKGTDKWVDLRRHATTEDAVRTLKTEGYRIIATTPHIDGTTPGTFDLEAGPFALVFGTEHAGITQEILDNADGYIHIPMQGFVESLNVSASAAILLQALTSRLRAENTRWGLGADEKAEILYRWTRSSVRGSAGILAKKFGE